jgi:heme-degrading monooxygenase HmoA
VFDPCVELIVVIGLFWNLRAIRPSASNDQKFFAMITVGMNYPVIAGKQTDFEQKFAAVMGVLRSAKGHSTSTLWKDVSDDASYLITSEWSDEQAFLDFIHSQAFKDVTSWGREQILAGRPQHKIYKS